MSFLKNPYVQTGLIVLGTLALLKFLAPPSVRSWFI